MSVANSAPFWIMAFIFVAIVVFQAIIFLKIARESAPDVGMTETEVKTAIRTGFISSIGPSFGIAIVLVSLIALLGSPAYVNENRNYRFCSNGVIRCGNRCKCIWNRT